MRVVPFRVRIPLPSRLADRIADRRARQFADEVVESIVRNRPTPTEFAAFMAQVKSQSGRPVEMLKSDKD